MNLAKAVLETAIGGATKMVRLTFSALGTWGSSFVSSASAGLASGLIVFFLGLLVGAELVGLA